MDIIVRESTFGRLLNHLTKGRVFPYPLHSISTVSLTSSSPGFTSEKGDGPYKLIGWTGSDDPEKPMNWSTGAKFMVMLGVMILNFSFYAAAAIFTPSIPGIEEDFQVGAADGTLGLSLFVIAYGIGPLILSPLSNIPSIGRTPVYILGLLCFFVLQIGTAVAKNIQTVLILRSLAGLFGSAPISVGGATLSEIYGPSHMPYAIAFYAVSGVCGPILGPIIGTGAILQWHTWRASMWVLAGMSAFALVWMIFFLPETLYDNILLRRAQRIRKRTRDETIRSEGEVKMCALSISRTVANQIVADFRMSFADPIILFVNLHTMLIYGVLYLWFEFFPFVFADIYGFTPLQQALAFFGIFIGAVISVIVYLLWLRFSYEPSAAKLGASYKPEVRLIPGQIGAACIPICLFIFSWTSRDNIHWIAPIIGTAFFAPGFYLTFQSALNYLGESYPRHVASVFAGNTFFRSSFGGALPLAAPAMLSSLGLGWASSILGFISVAMLPLPFILARYGEKLRAWSSYAN